VALEQHQAKELWTTAYAFTFKDLATEQGPRPAPGEPADGPGFTVLKGAQGERRDFSPPAPQRTDAHAVALCRQGSPRQAGQPGGTAYQD